MGALAAETPVAEPALAEPAAAESVAAEPAIAEPVLETPVAAVATESPAFENLVDQVEQSLIPATETLPPMAAPTVAAAAPAPSSEKNDADLVAEFEKMLSG
jgi:2-oxoglutarate dehydrogenase E2 component (dihydrolipoamide succinyltransferase)